MTEDLLEILREEDPHKFPQEETLEETPTLEEGETLEEVEISQMTPMKGSPIN
jgi:hypothetical protein